MEENEKAKIIKICLIASNNCYRNIVDILFKMSQQKIEMSQAKEALHMLRTYKSDHIQLLPKMESLLKKDKLFARVVLWALTEIKGPISFNLLNRLTYVMYMTKKFERDDAQGSEFSKLPGTSAYDEAAQFTVRERTCESEAMQSMENK